MADISIQRPTDQPTGNNRLKQELEHHLQNENFNVFTVIVAFAKVGPLRRLREHLEGWKEKENTIRAIFGIDQQGTSYEALRFVQRSFDETYIAHTAGKFRPTFHSKIYLFEGPNAATAYIGSNNLTVGGTETNYETYVKVEIELPEDQDLLDEINACWDDAQQVALPLNDELIDNLVEVGKVLTEKEMRQAKPTKKDKDTAPADGKAEAETPPATAFPTVVEVPPSPIPKDSMQQSKSESDTTEVTTSGSGATTLAMQVRPRPNGEIHLSKGAVDQDQSFFGWPFGGQTNPKKDSNPSYPQREPKPRVSLTVYDEHEDPIVSHDSFELTMVYYAPRSEIRITVPPDVAKSIVGYDAPNYVMLVMQESQNESSVEYVVDFLLPGNDAYNEYLSLCNQKMPSGGKPHPRKFGWV